MDLGLEAAALPDRMVESLRVVLTEQAGAWMSRAALCQALGEREVLPGERTLDKAFASLGSLEGVQTQWGKRGERLYRVG